MKIIDFISDVGLVRSVNEDSYLIDKNNKFAIVSDGMGGHEKGDIASELVVKTFSKAIHEFSIQNHAKDINVIISMLTKYLNNANEDSSLKIIDYANEHNIKDTMGATVAGIYLDKLEIAKVAIFHLGDSRVYRVRDNHLEQMTIDHSNDINNKNVLEKAIGNFEVFDLDIKLIDYQLGDLFLLCSDGINNFISDNELQDIIKNNSKDFCDIIKKHIYANGAKDNLTLIIVEVD
jgi:protein phosphatase